MLQGCISITGPTVKSAVFSPRAIKPQFVFRNCKPDQLVKKKNQKQKPTESKSDLPKRDNVLRQCCCVLVRQDSQPHSEDGRYPATVRSSLVCLAHEKAAVSTLIFHVTHFPTVLPPLMLLLLMRCSLQRYATQSFASQLTVAIITQGSYLRSNCSFAVAKTKPVPSYFFLLFSFLVFSNSVHLLLSVVFGITGRCVVFGVTGHCLDRVQYLAC